ncbi:hypothetical protein DLD77_05065 [Chitinophaga alhagiae]|uniref:Helicase HerA central domain-containing protein n=1 Tax=Chitinophaga alhagiae TaxID=2203219 RepID=A0ABN5LP17_9BACT|nr:ATP-binding protein [Chitinophaga alhagiae]AWO01110.1 hypothetical protein DLD77_05065 [Chitinophaga alhagiae]
MKDLSSFANNVMAFTSAYTPCTLFNWRQDGFEEPITCATESATHLLIAYELKQVPELQTTPDVKQQDQYREHLLKQKTFIDTVASVFLRPKKETTAFLDLRIRNNPATRTVQCYVLLRVVLRNASVFYDSKRLREEFRQLVPEDYPLYELSQEEIQELLLLSNQRVVEIRKKQQFIPVGLGYNADEMIVAPSGLLNWDEKSRFYLPSSSYLPSQQYNLAGLYRMLQNIDETVQVRISLGLCSLFEYEKNLALQYFKMLRSTYKDITSAELDASFKAFSKYVTAPELFSLKLQVAARSEITAMAVGNSLSAQMEAGNTSSPGQLTCLALNKEYAHATIKADWEECNHYFYPASGHEHYDGLDDTLHSFIRRLPYLCDAAEAAAVFRLPVANIGGLPGMIAKPPRPFFQPNPRSRKTEEIEIGRVITAPPSEINNEKAPQYTLPVTDLTKHGLIVGSTGSGKTNTTLNFVKELTKKGIPFLLIEPVKSEYYDELSPYFKPGELRRFNFKRPFLEDGSCNPEYLRFNPLIPIPGISSMQHISYIKGCFTAAFPMHGVMPMILEECLTRLYLELFDFNERPLFDAERSPVYLHDRASETLSEEEKNQHRLMSLGWLKAAVDLHLEDAEMFTDEDRANMGSYLKRRAEKLSKGVLGNAFLPELWLDAEGQPCTIDNAINTLLTQSVIIELEALPDNDEKALIMAFLLTYLFEYRQTMPSMKSIEMAEKDGFDPCKHIHITIIEEAHRLLSSGNMSTVSGGEDGVSAMDSKSKSISLFIDMLAEIRAKGEGIFIVEQIPTKLVSDVIKNTNLKIMHRITSKDDRHYLGEAMNMNEQQKNYVNNLKTGEAVIFEEQLDKPVFVKMNRFI